MAIQVAQRSLRLPCVILDNHVRPLDILLSQDWYLMGIGHPDRHQGGTLGILDIPGAGFIDNPSR